MADLPKLLALAAHDNIAVKISGACTLSHEPFPYNDIWDPLARIFDAFGFDRCMWGTDWTRAVALLTYKQGVEAFRVTDRLSDSDRAALMGETLTRVYNWSPHKSLIGRSDAALRVMIRHQLAESRDQLLAILNGVRPRIVASDQQAGGAELVVFEQRLRHRFGRADQRRRVSLSARRDGQRCPQAGVVQFGFGGGLQQPFGLSTLWSGSAAAMIAPGRGWPALGPRLAFGSRQYRAG